MIPNTLDWSIKVTDERSEKLNAALVELSSRPPARKVHVRNFASVAGQIIFLSSCVGSAARIITRFLFSVVYLARSWDSDISFSDDSLSEINL